MDGDVHDIGRHPGRRRRRLFSTSSAQVTYSSCKRHCPGFLEIVMHRYIVFLAIIGIIIGVVGGVILGIGMTINVFLSFVVGVFLIHGLYRSKFQTFLRGIQDKYGAIECSTYPTTSMYNRIKDKRECSDIFRDLLFDEIMVPAEVDEALERLLQLSVEKYIDPWHQDVTDEGSFLFELKDSIRFMMSVLIRRIERVDLSRLITRKLIRVGLSHLDCCLQAMRGKRDFEVFYSESSKLEDLIFRYYGHDLHAAMHSRTSELGYLHSLCGQIMPYLLPSTYLKCSTFTYLMRELFGSMILFSIMDTISEPYIINSLLVIIFDKTPMVHFAPSLFPKVSLLKRFVNIPPERCRSRLGLEVSSRTCSINQSVHLYPFLLYLKSEGKVGLLQFCLAVDDFNVRLLNPDLKDDDLRSLHQEAKTIFDVYMSPHGVDRLNFNETIIEEFRAIVEDHYSAIVKLQTSEPLYMAYEYAFRVLEINIPLFCRSEQYFEYVCGKRIRDKSAKDMNKILPRKGLSTAARIGNKINKIRGALMPTSAIDGSIEDDLSGDITDAGFEADEMKMDADSTYGDMDDCGVRDLNAWRVGVPRVDTRRDENGRTYFVFVIDVQRIDITNIDNADQFQWVVERRYDEFYVLESKLMEFHGGSVDIHLPVKRSFGNKGLDFMESRKAAFEEFLQRLLQKPTFRGSELLFTFLTSTGDFTKGLLPDINLGRIIKNVPMKLLKERGQHLEGFLQNFVASTEALKSKQNKTEFKDIYCHPLSMVARRLQKSIYADNAGKRPNNELPSSATLRSNSVLPQRSLCDYLLYLWLKVIRMPRWTLHLVLAIFNCFGSTLEALVERYLEVQLQEALIPQRIAMLVDLLREAIFPVDSVKRIEDGERKARRDEALSMAKKFLPRVLVGLIGRERHDIGYETLFHLIQQPRLNKQLLYTLLDVIVLELFPELNEFVIADHGEMTANASGDQMSSSFR